MKKILVHLPAVAKCVGGGVATQAEMTVQAAEAEGVEIVRYNPWQEYDWNQFGAVHIFRGDYETHNFAKLVHDKNIPLLVSSVFFSSHSAGKIRLLTRASSMLQKIAKGFRTDFDYVKEICEIATQILPNTDAEASLLIDSFGIPREKFTTVPNGVADRFSEAAPDLFMEKYGEKEIILSVANLGYRRKNLLNAVKAVAETDLPYYIIGPYYENDYGRACMKAIEETPNIHYLGAMDNSSPLLASAYAAAKLFLLPSLFETPGIASMEAALAGAEVVTTPYGGTKEYFGDLAIYAEPHSVEDIRSSVIKAWNGEAKHPGIHVKKEFLWEAIGRKMAEIYRPYL